MEDEGVVPIGLRLGELASRHPDRPAVIQVDRDGREQVLTWRRLERDSNVAARVLARRGVNGDSVVAVRLAAGLDHVVATLAAWKLGAVVLPVDPASTRHEFVDLVATARPDVVIAGPDLGTEDTGGTEVVHPEHLQVAGVSADPLPDQGIPRSAHATGGSTGRPRVILRRPSWCYPAELRPTDVERRTGVDVNQTQLIMLPLHHAGFARLHNGLALDHTIVLMTSFAPELAVSLIERYRVSYFVIVPAMMRRLLAVPKLRERDLSSVTTVHQSSAGCPPELKRAWFEVFAPHTLHEGYSSQERIGAVWIRGDEWLEHPGSVGKPEGCEVRVYRDTGEPAGIGEVGEVFLSSPFTRQPTYLGPGPALPERDGFLSLGDAGFLDGDGYLHIVGRRTEMINVGGTKVYPAEVERVLLRHDGVADVAVVHRAHDFLGQAVHAVVVPADPAAPPTTAALGEHCRARLSIAKVPLTYEFVPDVGRNDAGKLRRNALSPDVR